MPKGLEHARRFSWEKAARETLEVYQSVERELSIGYVPAEVVTRAETQEWGAAAPITSSVQISSQRTVPPLPWAISSAKASARELSAQRKP